MGSVVVFVTWKNAGLFEKVAIDKEEVINLQTAESKALSVNLLVDSYLDKISLKSEALIAEFNAKGVTEFSDRDISILKIEMNNQGGAEYLFTGMGESDQSYVEVINSKIKELEQFKIQILSGKPLIVNISDGKKIQFLLGVPLEFSSDKNLKSIAWAVINSDKLVKIFQSNDNRLYTMLDSVGTILVSSDQKRIVLNKVSKNEVLNSMKNVGAKTQQKYVSDEKNNKWLLTASQTNLGLYVIAQIPSENVIAPAKYMKSNSYYLLGMVLSGVIVILFFFSEHIAGPIASLSFMAQAVGRGDLEIEASKKINSRDEVGDLAVSFDEMVAGLRERQKMQNVLNKFHGTTITQELMSQEITRQGSTKDVTIFFSDIRGFTDFSEHHSPVEVVEMLNEYFEVMVHIINKNGGVVDKFIGDAIMAVWGIPNSGPNDSINAVRACLEMRLALAKLNEERILRNLLPIKIGMGLHAGHVVSGTVGSSERMEYTIIGDNVNTASRIEASTKTFGTDLLISEEVTNRIAGHFIIMDAGKASVLGKSEPLKLFKVNGHIDSEGRPVMVRTPYSSYQAEEDKKSKIVT